MKKIANFFQKPLDKPHKVWYNIDTVRERKTPRTTEYKNWVATNAKGDVLYDRYKKDDLCTGSKESY